MSAKYEHIIWDWNGTLVDDVSVCLLSINTMLKRRGLAELDLSGYQDKFGFPVKKFYLELGFDLDREDWESMAKEFHDIYLGKLGMPVLRSGAVSCLDSAGAAAVRMSVLSASHISILESLLVRAGIRGMFHAVHGLSDLYASSKVEQGRALINDASVPPELTLLLGDTIHDYEVSIDLGCRCILIPGGHQSRSRLEECGCDVMDYDDLEIYLRSVC